MVNCYWRDVAPAAAADDDDDGDRSYHVFLSSHHYPIPRVILHEERELLNCHWKGCSSLGLLQYVSSRRHKVPKLVSLYKKKAKDRRNAFLVAISELS